MKAAITHHEATANVCELLVALVCHGGWLSTTEISEKTGIHRDVLRRMLRELAERAWVCASTFDGKELWTIGPELPRIGIQYQALLVARSQQLRNDFDRLNTPFEGETR